MTFETEPVLQGYGPDLWRLVTPLEYVGLRDTFVVPVGFLTDFTSVPRVFTWLIPKTGVYTRASILHDYLCSSEYGPPVSRSDADGIFRRVLRELNVSPPRRWLMWTAVRLASRMSDATWYDWAHVILILLIAVPLLILPVALVCLVLVALAVIEFLISGQRPPG